MAQAAAPHSGRRRQSPESAERASGSSTSRLAAARRVARRSPRCDGAAGVNLRASLDEKNELPREVATSGCGERNCSETVSTPVGGRSPARSGHAGINQRVDRSTTRHGALRAKRSLSEMYDRMLKTSFRSNRDTPESEFRTRRCAFHRRASQGVPGAAARSTGYRGNQPGLK